MTLISILYLGSHDTFIEQSISLTKQNMIACTDEMIVTTSWDSNILICIQKIASKTNNYIIV